MDNSVNRQIESMIKESSEVISGIKAKSGEMKKVAGIVADAIKNGNKIILAGNGGSASQATHIAAEFTGRYKIEREGLAAISLSTDLSAITAIGNDYGFERIFERQIEALGKKGDVFIAISTSGNSPNLARAVEKAKKINLKTISLLGKNGGKMKGMSDLDIVVPSDNTPRIQEAHIMILHIICEIVDEELFAKRK